jgi:squalene-hopene/tetraprenyl-beta-curcumene cyclase
MKCYLIALAFVVCLAEGSSAADAPTTWNAVAAAKYLDSRATWWQNWPPSQRDHQTVCVSCHTMLPYALSRPKLGAALDQKDVPGPELSMLQSVRKRVSLWGEVEPYYLDAKSGRGKSKESRSTEAVLNALILASNDAERERLAPITRTAFNAAWTLQIKSGNHAGAWDWQVFRLAPWEAVESQYQGATFMALAVGWSPGGYGADPAIQANLQLLRSYLRREYASQPLLNRIVLLWASGKFSGLLSNNEKLLLIDDIVKQQRPDGGWSLASLGNWVRPDHTPQEKDSDGYATGVVTLALKQAGIPRHQEAWRMGRTWLEQHQNKEDGSWRAYSLNKKRDLTTDVGRFMTDAATGYAVLALAATR